MDREIIRNAISEIKNNKGLYQMSNEPLAKEMLPHLRKSFPELKLIKCGSNQWFVATPTAQKKLLNNLKNVKEQKEKELMELKKAMYAITEMVAER